MHDDPDDEETRAHTARRAADQVDREMLGGEEEFWGPFGEVASTGSTEARATTHSDEAGVVHAATSCSESCTTIARLTTSAGHGNGRQGGVGVLFASARTSPQRRGSPPAEVTITFPRDIAGGGGTVGSSSGGGDGTSGGGGCDGSSRGGRDSISSAGGDGSIIGGRGGTGGRRSGSSGGAGGTVGSCCGGGVAGPVEDEIAAQAEVQRGGDDEPHEHLMQQFLTKELDPVIAALDIMERERTRLLASSNPCAQAFTRVLEEARLRETGGNGVQGGVVAGEDVAEGVAAEADDEAMPGGLEAADVAVEGRPQAEDEVVQARQRRDEGTIDARRVVQETATGPVVPFSGLHLAQGRQSQAVQMAVHGVPPLVVTDLGSEPLAVPPRLPSHFAPQDVRLPLDAEELARQAVRDVTRLDRWIFDRRPEHPAWQAIPSIPWGPASHVWCGSTSTGGHTDVAPPPFQGLA
ncbi:hypothetical protein CBR_g55535 [Chara braunii]|uniref:Uncharacterized protein n=1 Tax=Chara braunii TaxID=69332 RepID=A0A388MD13_CHABU|nr:hypothetical protein CBR_g55535 [Chara braunii]|eukprot:GBG92454.1 hypothetical protein CBR_g55535 [Chara braunii]